MKIKRIKCKSPWQIDKLLCFGYVNAETLTVNASDEHKAAPAYGGMRSGGPLRERKCRLLPRTGVFEYVDAFAAELEEAKKD